MILICDYTHDPHMLINMISICGSCVSSHMKIIYNNLHMILVWIKEHMIIICGIFASVDMNSIHKWMIEIITVNSVENISNLDFYSTHDLNSNAQ